MASPGTDQIVDLLKRAGVPVTRENYIAMSWGDVPSEWDAELESELPENLQRWDLFKRRDGKVVYTGSMVGDFNPNHDPHSGEFATSGGSGSPQETVQATPSHFQQIRQRLRDAEHRAAAIPSTEYNFSPERVKLRDQIADHLYNRGIENRQRNKIATIITGLPASGKSTLSKPFVAAGALEVDPDLAKEQLPEYENGVGAAAVHEESSLITKKVLAKAIQNGDDFVWPRVDSPEKVVNDIKNLQKMGYKVHLEHLEVPMRDAIHSAVGRFMNTGRYVPLSLIRQFGKTPRETYERGKQVADSAVMYERSNGGVRRVA